MHACLWCDMILDIKRKTRSVRPQTVSMWLCIQENNAQEITQDMYEPSMILQDHKLLLRRSFARTVSQIKMCDFAGETWRAVIFYECNNNKTALQRQVLQTALWHYTC
jgi:hypothetical protein